MKEESQKELEDIKEKNKEEIKNLEIQYNNRIIENLNRINDILNQYQNNIRGIFNAL